MIKIHQKLIDLDQLYTEIPSKQKLKIMKLMAKSNKVYEYGTIGELEFELMMRLQIVRAAVLLNKSGADFATFTTSRCNEKYWRLTEKGAFVLKENVLPQTAIKDIFINGKLYAFECATAMVIIFYKAVFESIEKAAFNRLFSGLILFDWKYDEDLNLRIYDGTEFLPGDCVYFKNPDFDPSTPHWQGENGIVLDHDLYFAHGIGIVNGKLIIDFLNTKRKRNFSQSAYLMSFITQVNFQYLSQFKVNRLRETSDQLHSNLIISEIGSKLYIG
ncbi:protein-glutamine gamma-glutamyltransferase [Bacillus sp. FJAT-27445]|uniref:protein-glutamine gamma-glutamyltransferase n=1 Tax=Bacillus sp. FJAT-27445 TaxID=1679166 RepID=UPI000743A411|nr:protein-glutamine gamma-glutamyltransferase [Bacillus sp. FJAT-27445]